MGFITGMPANCLRYGSTSCLITNDLNQLYGSAFISVSTIPLAFETIPTINSYFPTSINLYFLKAGTYKKSPGYTIYINSAQYSSNNVSDFSSALAEAVAPYSTIILAPGSYTYLPYQGAYQTISNPYDPLATSSSFIKLRKLQELTIQGFSAYSTIVYLTANVVVSGFANKISYKNLTFSGQKILSQNCTTDSCFYCPAINNIIGNLYDDDRSNLIRNISNYVIPCLSVPTVPFTPNNSLYIENTVFINIRSQP